jgi:hypothetical protein
MKFTIIIFIIFIIILFVFFLVWCSAQFYHEFIAKPCRALESIVREEVICEGTYGTVWVAKDRFTNETVALKQLKNTIGRYELPQNPVFHSSVVTQHIINFLRYQFAFAFAFELAFEFA